MSQSLVPDIKISRGNNRKNKFNVSSNTHTTAEVGYLQPTFSKMLLPDSDLKLKVNDFVRMSSLVVPTFGDMSLRHWFNCTPLSSLWSCYGSYMTQSQYNDLDSLTGSSVRRFMPMFSVNELFGELRCRMDNVSSASDYLPFYGNLSYCRWNGKVLSPVEVNAKNGGNGVTLIRNINKYGFAASTFVPDTQETCKTSSKRFRVPFSLEKFGVVLKNTDATVLGMTTSSGVTNFPTPSECPYVLWVLGSTGNSFAQPADHSSAYSSSHIVYPLTVRMFQGDTDPTLYTNGFEVKMGTSSGGQYYHATGNSNGWYLHSDDSYFTGNLDSATFDVDTNAYTSATSYVVEIASNFSRRFKRMRKLFVGLGYQFNPFDTQPQTPWKLMHYYKAWFDMFYPKRDTQYYQTPLSRLVQFLSYHGNVCKPNMFDAFRYEASQSTTGYTYNFIGDFLDIIFTSSDAKYVLPIDYYSLADTNPQEREGCKSEDIKDNANLLHPLTSINPGHGESSSSLNYGNTFGDGLILRSHNYADGNGGITHDNSNTIDGLTVKLAEKLTTFLTKKRIVGKSVSDRMRAIFGVVDPHDKSHESTWCFGTTSTGINISAVMSQAETNELHLGDYAGQGLGGSQSRTFSVNGNDADMFIVTIMSAVVPKIAYYQGHSRENMVGISPNEFITPLWDAVGYDDVHASEYIADITTCTDLAQRDMSDINGQIIGLVPRGTWYKVNPHDTLNGDMSLPSVKDSLSPYVLTKDIKPNFSISPIDMRTIDPISFNKIFNESNDLDDHFIIQMHIEADMYAPLKSISTSYDTFDSDEDGTIEVSHS